MARAAGLPKFPLGANAVEVPALGSETERARLLAVVREEAERADWAKRQADRLHEQARVYDGLYIGALRRQHRAEVELRNLR